MYTDSDGNGAQSCTAAGRECRPEHTWASFARADRQTGYEQDFAEIDPYKTVERFPAGRAGGAVTETFSGFCVGC